MSPAVIICGDFNSPPHTLLYQLLSPGHLDDDILDSLRRTCHSTDQVTINKSVNQHHLTCIVYLPATTDQVTINQSLNQHHLTCIVYLPATTDQVTINQSLNQHHLTCIVYFLINNIRSACTQPRAECRC